MCDVYYLEQLVKSEQGIEHVKLLLPSQARVIHSNRQSQERPLPSPAT